MSFFTEEDINEVRERSDLVEIVSQYVSLKKLGHSYKGLCPFHQEKTASFFVNSTKQLYHCFGCGEGGNVFTFVSKMEKLEFPDALKLLADRIGYKLRYSQENKKRISREEKLFKINQEALNVYHEQLIKSEIGKKALNYLLKRGFNKNTLDVFKIGFSFPGWDTLTKRMMKEGYPLEELIQAGLSIEGSRGPYDRFRGRVIFPICDLRKRIIGFGARIIEEKKEEPKYVNTPETMIFHKGSILYNLNLARSEIVKEDNVFVVEGYTDVIMLFQNGVKNVVATLGTAFTSEHLKTLSRFSSSISLSFDSDTAGKTAAERGLELLGETGSEVKVMELPQGYDPADFVQKKGREGFLKLSNKSMDLIDFCLQQRVGKLNLKNTKEKIDAITFSLEIVSALLNRVAQEDYLIKIAEMLDISEEFLRLEFKKFQRYNKDRRAERQIYEKSITDPKLKAEEIREKEILKILLQDEFLKNKYFDRINIDYYFIEGYKNILGFLKNITQNNKTLNQSSFIDLLKDETEKKLASQLMFEKINVDDKEAKRKIEKKKKELEELEEKNASKNDINKNQNEIISLQKEISEKNEKLLQSLILRVEEHFIEYQIRNLKKEFKNIDPSKDSKKYDYCFEEILQLEKLKRNLKI